MESLSVGMKWAHVTAPGTQWEPLSVLLPLNRIRRYDWGAGLPTNLMPWSSH